MRFKIYGGLFAFTWTVMHANAQAPRSELAIELGQRIHFLQMDVDMTRRALQFCDDPVEAICRFDRRIESDPTTRWTAFAVDTQRALMLSFAARHPEIPDINLCLTPGTAPAYCIENLFSYEHPDLVAEYSRLYSDAVAQHHRSYEGPANRALVRVKQMFRDVWENAQLAPSTIEILTQRLNPIRIDSPYWDHSRSRSARALLVRQYRSTCGRHGFGINGFAEAAGIQRHPNRIGICPGNWLSMEPEALQAGQDSEYLLLSLPHEIGHLIGDELPRSFNRPYLAWLESKGLWEATGRSPRSSAASEALADGWSNQVLASYLRQLPTRIDRMRAIRRAWQPICETTHAAWQPTCGTQRRDGHASADFRIRTILREDRAIAPLMGCATHAPPFLSQAP